MISRANLTNELKRFHRELKSYKSQLERLDENKMILGHWIRERDELREKLVRKTGMLKNEVIELTNKQYMTLLGNSYEIWSEAFNQVGYSLSKRQSSALNFCIDAVNEAIGRLESDIKLGIRDDKGKIIKNPTIAEPAHVPEDHKERRTKHAFGKEIRKHLQGTPEEIAPHIVRVAQEFQFPEGFNCYAEEQDYKASQFSKQFIIYRITNSFTPGVIWGGAKPEELPCTIGSITLQSLPNNKALFVAKYISYSLDSNGSYFDSFLERLSSEFKNLGFEETKRQKTWRWFKEIIEIGSKLKP